MNVNYTPDVGNTLAATEIKSFLLSTSAPGTDLAEVVIGTIGPSAGIAIDRMVITPTSALTASDTLATTITVTKRTAAGAPVTLATVNTKTTGGGGTGNWVAWTPIVVPAVAGIAVAAGDVITIATTHLSTGTQIPAGTVVELFMKAT